MALAKYAEEIFERYTENNTDKLLVNNFYFSLCNNYYTTDSTDINNYQKNNQTKEMRP